MLLVVLLFGKIATKAVDFDEGWHRGKRIGNDWLVLIAKIDSIAILPLLHERVGNMPPIKIIIISNIILFLDFPNFLNRLIPKFFTLKPKLYPKIPFMQMHFNRHKFICFFSKYLSHLIG